MNFKGKRILVTGGSGFIGVNLIKRLKELGAQIENFDLLLGFDIQNEKQLESTAKKKFEIIYHLAGFSGSSQSNFSGSKCFKINTLATANLLEFLAKYSPLTKLIISSSRLEYGKAVYLPVNEDHPINPISFYGLSRLLATQMALIYHQKNHLAAAEETRLPQGSLCALFPANQNPSASPLGIDPDDSGAIANPGANQ